MKTAKFLGLVVSDDLKWNAHIDAVLTKASKRLYFLVQLKRAGAQPNEFCSFYTTCIYSVIEYSCQADHFALPEYLSDNLERLQRRTLRISFAQLSYDHATAAVGIKTLKERRLQLCKKLYSDISNNPDHKLYNILAPANTSSYQSRTALPFIQPKCKTNRFRNTFINARIRKI